VRETAAAVNPVFELHVSHVMRELLLDITQSLAGQVGKTLIIQLFRPTFSQNAKK